MVPVVVGMLVIIGWHLKIPVLFQLSPDLVPMQYNTALCFLLLSGAKIAQIYHKRFLSLLLTTLVLLVAGLTFAEYIFSININIDELFVEHYVTTETPFPGRMSLNTSICFVLLSVAMLISLFKSNKFLINTSLPLSAFVCAVGAVSTLGYIIQLESAYSWSAGFSAMAIHTSVCFVLLSISIIISYVQRNFTDTNWALCLSSFFFITSSFFTISLFQQFNKQEQALLSTLEDVKHLIGENAYVLDTLPTANIVLVSGLFLSLLLGTAAYVAITANIQKQELEKRSLDLNTANEELEEFAYRTSHDLRSPLVSSIKLMELSSRFIDEGDTGRAKEIVTTAKSALQKLETLIQDLLILTRTKNENEEEQTVQIGALINHALSKIDHMDGFEQVKIIQKISYDKDIYTKKSRLQLIVDNLLSNAIKYHDPKEKTPHIILKSTVRNDIFTFIVEDNGLGIPKDDQSKIFTMFKRFHTKVSYGSGLGLYMIKKSAEILDGTISFEDIGKGSRFTLKIPYKKIL